MLPANPTDNAQLLFFLPDSLYLPPNHAAILTCLMLTLNTFLSFFSNLPVPSFFLWRGLNFSFPWRVSPALYAVPSIVPARVGVGVNSAALYSAVWGWGQQSATTFMVSHDDDGIIQRSHIRRLNPLDLRNLAHLELSHVDPQSDLGLSLVTTNG